MIEWEVWGYHARFSQAKLDLTFSPVKEDPTYSNSLSFKGKGKEEEPP